MYIGSLMDKRSGISGDYSFYWRGTKKPCPPDILSDAYKQANYKYPIYEGILFSGKPFGWQGLTVFDTGIDLAVKFGRECYIDSVTVKLSEISSLGDLIVLSENQSGERDIVGIKDRSCDPLIDEEGVSRFSIKRADHRDKSRIVIPVGFPADNIIIRFKANLSDIIVEEFDVSGAVFDNNIVYPVPVRIEQLDTESLNPVELKKIIISEDADEDCRFSANLLKEKLYENYLIEIPVWHFSQASDLSGSIIMGKHGDIEIVDREFINRPIAEGYNLKAGSFHTYINAADRLGLILGVEALLQLYKNKAGQCSIENYPRMAIRGIHIGLPPREEIPFVKRLIRYLLAPLGYNTIFLEFAGGMRYYRHPEINEAWEKTNREDIGKPLEEYRTYHGHMVAGGSILEQNEVADFVAYVRSYGMDVIPEVQSFSHVQYITCAHPEIGEIDEKSGCDDSFDQRIADKPPQEEFPNSYCPSNEKSYEIIFDLVDEIVDVAKPKKYVHMGHDEIYTIGVCPRCKGKEHAALYASDINRIYNYLAGKNLKMMIWSDMLQPSTSYKTPPAIDMIPKDIIMLDFIWYFNFNLDHEDNLISKDFKVIAGNLYSSHYPRYEQRISKRNMIGAEVSTWCRADERTLAREGKLYDFIYTANMVWSSAYSESLRFVYNKIIASLIPDLRSKLHGRQYPSLRKEAEFKPLPLPPAKIKVPCNIMHKIPQNNVCNYREIPFDLSSAQIISYNHDKISSVSVPVGESYDSLIFLHTAGENVKRVAWEELPEIGRYVVLYVDGTKCEVPIEYGGNIRVWHQRYGEPLLHKYYRHDGYTATYFADAFIETKASDGRDITVYGYEWVNPYKNKKITSITCTADYESGSEIILFAITGVDTKRVFSKW